MISYLSTPYKSTIEPYKENVNLIAQVAQQKQSKYDSVLSTIFQKQNQLLDLDLSGGSEEAELKKDNLLKEADNQLNKMASSDLTIPDNINKVENIFSPIVNDKDIMNAAGITAFTKEQAAYFDEWKKEGKGLYDALNHSYFLEKTQKNRKMSIEEAKQKGYNQVTAVEFVDYDKLMRESIKELMPNVTVTIAQDGSRIYTEDNKILSEQDILARLPMNSKIMAQAEINSYYQFKDVDADTLLNIQKESFNDKLNSNNAVINKYNENIGFIQEQISEIKKDSDVGKKSVISSGLDKEQYIKKLNNDILEINNVIDGYTKENKKYNTELEEFNNIYKFNKEKNIFEKEFSIDELDRLKTSSWIAMTNSNFAKATSYEERKISVEYDEMWMKMQDYENSVNLENLKTINKIEEQKDADSRDPNKISYDADGNVIPKSGVNLSDVYSTTIANEKLLEKSLPKKGEEFEFFENDLKNIDDNMNELRYNYIQNEKIINPNLYEGLSDKEISKKISDKFLNEEKQYRNILEKFKDENTKPKSSDYHTSGSTETYQQYFDNNKKLKDYIIKIDALKAEKENSNLLIKTIKKEAEEKTKGDLGIKTLEKEYIVTYKLPPENQSSIITGRSEEQKNKNNTLKIPKSVSVNYLNNKLTDKDYNIIIDANPSIGYDPYSDDYFKNNTYFNSVPEDEKIELIKNSIPTDDIYAKYKTTYNDNKNKLASEYQKGFLLPGVIIKNKTEGKGKEILDYAKSYIQSFEKDKKYATSDIDVNYFYRNPKSLSGWSMKYTISGKKGDLENNITSVSPLSTEVDLMEKFVSDNRLNMLGNIDNITKNLELQEKGSPEKNIHSYTHFYLGKKYQFVKDKYGIKAYELVPGSKSIEIDKSYSSINNLIEMIEIKRELELKMQE